MKKNILLTLLLCVFTWNVYADGKPIPQDQLPKAAQAFVQKHFGNEKILQASKEMEGLSWEYEVMLTNVIEVKFNSKGEWMKVESKTIEIPEVLIPAKILQYVKTNFPGQKIIEVKKEKKHTEVKLLNDLELKFDKKDNLVKIDD